MQLTGTADTLFKQMRGVIEAIDLPAGYKLEWGGKSENEEQLKVQNHENKFVTN